MKDLFGKALLDYQNGNYTEDIITSTNISGEDTLPLKYLFRSYNEMPEIEQKALQLATGNILDIGAGAGSHSLYLQQKGQKIKAIDISPGAIKVCKARGIINAEEKNILEYPIASGSVYDTIFLLMNGTGIFKTLEATPLYLKKLKQLLKPNGQILIDSSDIKYMFEDEDGGFWKDLNSSYYGELDYFLSYKGEDEAPIKWLYLDFSTLTILAATAGLKCKKVLEGKHFDYLAKLYL